MGTGHGKAVDWWMLGVLLYELLAGRAPFEAESTQLVYELVKRGIEAVRFPPECRRLAADLVRRLCCQNPEARIRTPLLRDHPWFRGFDWATLRALRMPTPYVPQVRHPRDLTNFRSCDGEDPPVTPYQDTGSGWDAGFEDDALGAGAHAAGARAMMGCISAETTTRPTANVAPGVVLSTPDESVRMVLYSPRSEAAHYQHQLRQAAPTTRANGAATIQSGLSPARWQATSQTAATSKGGVLAQRTPQSPPASPVLGGG